MVHTIIIEEILYKNLNFTVKLDAIFVQVSFNIKNTTGVLIKMAAVLMTL